METRMTHETNPKGAVRLGLAVEMGFSALLLAFGALCIDTSVPETVNFLVPEYLDSALYSQIVGVLLVLVTLYHMYAAIKKRRPDSFLPYTTIIGLVFIFLYVLGFTYVGFYCSTFVFLIGFSLLIEDPEDRNFKAKVGFSCLSVAVLYAAFTAFKIYLPTAWLF